MNNIVEIKHDFNHDPYQILEHPNIGVCLFYPNGKILYVNDKFASIYQSNPSEMPDRRIQEFCHYTVQNLADFLKNIVNGLPVSPQEMYSMGYYYLYKIQGIYKNNRLVLVVTLVDVTQYKRIELALQQSNKQLEQNRLLDRVTGLSNFSAFEARIQDIYQSKDVSTVSILLIDIDHFKKFNVENGFEYGESALQIISNSLERLAQSNASSLYYLGGNEFIFIISDVKNWNLYTFAEQIRCEIFQLNLYFSQGIAQRLTVSLAMHKFLTGTEFDIDFFLVKLKKLMAMVKAQGGNNWIESDQSMFTI